MKSHILIACFLIAALGCGGGGSAGVSGKVLYNGVPVEKGTIAFHPVSSGTPFGASIQNGEFKVEKESTGKFRVLVRGMRTSAKPPTREEAAAGPVTPSLDYIAEDAPGNGQEVDIAGRGQALEIQITGAPAD